MAKTKAAAKSVTADVPFAVTEWPANRVETWPLDNIHPYEKNARTHPASQISLLAQLMRKRGVDQPIVVDEQGIILKGHGRRLAALEAGFTEFPVVVHRGLSDTDKRALRIEDNQVALLSGWDNELLRLEVGDLKLNGYDIPLLGFDSHALDSLLTIEVPEAEIIPEKPTKPVVCKGDLWMLGQHRILCGDSTSAHDVTLLLSDAKPNLMVTDPPYGVDYDPAWRARAGVNLNRKKLGTLNNDDRSDWREAWMLFSGDVAYVWHGGLHAGEVAVSLNAAGFALVGQIIWVKDRMVLSRGDYHWQHEPCWYVVRQGKRHNWCSDRSQTTTWMIPARDDSGHGHGTQKPIECMKRPIENNSKRGDFIYEPFAGSGTTIIACEMLERRCLANEIDPGYVQVCIERWQQFTGKAATHDGVPFDKIREKHEAGNPRKPVRGRERATGPRRAISEPTLRATVHAPQPRNG